MAAATDKYRSIAAPSEGVFKDRGSRFLALAFPVSDEAEIRSIVASLKTKYHDARHHCYAWRLGLDGISRSSDDGEPSGSAGKQILGRIESKGLSDVLVVVVRWFGGIKLGVPGLIRAYRESTAEALGAAVEVEKTAEIPFVVTFGYLSMNDVMKVLKDLSLPQLSLDCGESCSVKTRVRLTSVEDFQSRLSRIDSCSVQRQD